MDTLMRMITRTHQKTNKGIKIITTRDKKTRSLSDVMK
jgi:hypothetical protein